MKNKSKLIQLFILRLKFQKRSALKFVSRSESQISEAQRTEICWTNYPRHKVPRDSEHLKDIPGA